jgi:hypothetical protein
VGVEPTLDGWRVSENHAGLAGTYAATEAFPPLFHGTPQDRIGPGKRWVSG